MKLYLQFGYGMMDHSRCLIREWGKGTVILSPRDLEPQEPDRLQSTADAVRGVGGRVLVDPQFYLPHCDHERLRSHDYWPPDYESMSFWAGEGLRQLLRKLLALNERLPCQRLILPGLFANPVDEDWLTRQAAVFEEAPAVGIDMGNALATVALSNDATRNDDQVSRVLEAADCWPVAGIYLVIEHPSNEYLVQDESWLTNALDLAAGFRLKGKRVVLGYCNQQMLIAACASVNAVASGTWMNVRHFPPEKFNEQDEDDVRKRTRWYYCPQALSEFKIPTMDTARRQGVLDRIQTPLACGSNYANILFEGPQPSTVEFTEPTSFRHYLTCLRHQVRHARHDTFDATLKAHETLLDGAEELLDVLHAVAVNGGLRDFKCAEAFQANRAALCVLNSTRGPLLRRFWNTL
jgi:hypothetical protein